jgi:heat shock protein HspQ
METTMRVRHTKRDSNHADVAAGCRRAGLHVFDVADLGGYVLDLIVSGFNRNEHRYEMVMVEIKPSRDAPFTEDEERTLQENPDTTMVAYCAEDVLKRFGWDRLPPARRENRANGSAINGFNLENIVRKAVASCRNS